MAKTSPKKTRSPKKNRLRDALHAIRNGGVSKHAAARIYKVSRQSLIYHCRTKSPKKRGPPPVLTIQEETVLKNWILNCLRKGFPLHRIDIMLSVKEFLDLNPRENCFKNNMPGKTWFRNFLKRNDLSERYAEGVTQASANVSEHHIRTWFEKVSDVLKEESHYEILKKPSRVFNADETGFVLNPSGGKVVCEKGAKNVYNIEKGASKTSVTVLFTFSASGQTAPPMVIYPFERISSDILNSFPDKWGLGRNKSGWMKAELFYEYIANVFNPWLEKKRIEKPVILFVDGHKSHLTYQLSELCRELQIVLISLYPNATRILQPADVSCFKPLKNGWKFGVHEWAKKHPGEVINFKNFASILEIVVNNHVKPNTVVNGFKACGLYPWDPNAIDYSKCLAKSKENVPEVEDNIDDVNVNDHVSDPEVQDSQEPSTLSFSHFKQVIGEDLLEKVLSDSDDMLIDDLKNGVKNIYNFFNSMQAESSTIETPPISNSSPGNIESPTDKDSPASSGENVEKCSSSNSLEKILHWPDSPKKKMKRNYTKMPYVITCNQWKEITEQKNAAKEQEANLKAERKKLREEKRKTALEMKKIAAEKKVEMKMKTKEEKKSKKKAGVLKKLCYKCERNIGNTQKFYDCSSCVKSFHQKCIPKSFEDNLPDSDDEGEFVCPQCFKIDDEDDFSDSSEESN